MKRLIPTIVLVLLCIGGFWYANSHNFFKEKTPEAPALVTVNKEDVQSYSIKNGDTETVLTKKDGAWTMMKPGPLPLTAYEPGAWLEDFIGVKKDRIVSANPTDLGQYGLAVPKQSFTVKLSGGTEQTIFVGDMTPVGGSYYAKLDGSPEVFELPEATMKSLSKKPIDFMEKAAVRVEYEKTRSLSINWKGTSWTLLKTEPDKSSFEAKWKLGDRELQGTDSTGFMDRANSLVTEQLAKPPAEVPGLDKPDLRIEVKAADDAGKESTVVYTGKSEGDLVWIAKQGGEWAFAVPAAAVQELADHAKAAPETAAPVPGTDIGAGK